MTWRNQNQMRGGAEGNPLRLLHCFGYYLVSFSLCCCRAGGRGGASGDIDDICIVEEHFVYRPVSGQRGYPSGSSPPDIWSPPRQRVIASRPVSTVRPGRSGRGRRPEVVTLDSEDENDISSTSTLGNRSITVPSFSHSVRRVVARSGSLPSRQIARGPVCMPQDQVRC